MESRKYTEKYLQKLLWYKYFKTHKYLFTNCYYFEWEADFLTFTKDFLWEIEIKCTAADFKADFKKVKKHEKLSKKVGVPNKFWYLAPKGVVDEKDIPAYAGFMVADKGQIVIHKRAPILTRKNLKVERLFNHVYYTTYLKAQRAVMKKIK